MAEASAAVVVSVADLAAAIRAAAVPQAVGDMEPIKNMLSERPRNQRVDLLKGIAIFFVIFFHCYYHSPDALLQPVRNVYLHIFFFIAGLFFSLKSGFPALFFCSARGHGRQFTTATCRQREICLNFSYALLMNPCGL